MRLEGFEPPTRGLGIRGTCCTGLPRIANPAYLSPFFFSGLPNIPGHCVPGGVRVVSIALPLSPPKSRGAGLVPSSPAPSPIQGGRLSSQKPTSLPRIERGSLLRGAETQSNETRLLQTRCHALRRRTEI